MKWLVIATINIQNSDGISKKIKAEASAFATEENNARLVCLINDKPALVSINNRGETDEETELATSNENRSNHFNKCRALCKFAKKIVDESIDAIYVRHMFPTIELLELLLFSKKNKKKIVYEIPTFPYYREQYNESKNKVKTIIRLGIESLYWPIIYAIIDELTVVRCNSNSIKTPKMLDIKNGLPVIPNKVYQHIWNENSRKINIIGVGTLYKYHGYQKVIDAICGTNKIYNGVEFYFYIVGESEETSRLKNYCEQNEFDNVIFCGKVFGEDLERLYALSDIAIGTMALNLRKADIDTAIKNIEYLSKGLPIITSGRIFDVSPDTGLYTIVKPYDSLTNRIIYEFVKNYSITDKTDLLLETIKGFSWKRILSIITQTGKMYDEK